MQCDSTAVNLAALCKRRSHRIDEKLSMQLQTVLVQRAVFESIHILQSAKVDF